MNYEGKPCKKCGEIIEIYSTSGYCRRCWHKRRGGRNFVRLPQEERIQNLLQHHRKDLYNYHYISINGFMVAEHRYVFEKAAGKSLSKGWVVHHLNGLKGDNRLENLAAMPKGDHDSKSLIKALEERIRQLELKNG